LVLRKKVTFKSCIFETFTSRFQKLKLFFKLSSGFFQGKDIFKDIQPPKNPKDNSKNNFNLPSKAFKKILCWDLQPKFNQNELPHLLPRQKN